MNHKDDFCQFQFPTHTSLFLCSDLRVNWPPPEKFSFLGSKFKRMNMSAITDEQIKDMDRIARGAQYQFVKVEDTPGDKDLKLDKPLMTLQDLMDSSGRKQ